jgi:hypothetical protein
MSKKSLTGEYPPLPVRFHEVEIDERFYVDESHGFAVFKKISCFKAKRLFLRSLKSKTRFFWPFSAVLLSQGKEKTSRSLGDILPVDAHSPNCDHAHDAKGPGSCELSRVEQPHSDNANSGPSC